MMQQSTAKNVITMKLESYDSQSMSDNKKVQQRQQQYNEHDNNPLMEKMEPNETNQMAKVSSKTIENPRSYDRWRETNGVSHDVR